MSVSGSAPGLYALDPQAPALALGFWQMTITRPLRRMTLHFSQMGFTEGLTFMMLNLLLVDTLVLIWSAR